MKVIRPKPLRKVEMKPVLQPEVPLKLRKDQPGYFAAIGRISAKKRKLSSDYFSKMAKKSHAPTAKRKKAAD